MAFQIIRNDITKIKADAIVNTANPEPIYASGTDGAIYQAAGAAQLLAERKKIGCIDAGQAAVTSAFALDAKYIIHTVGPAWWDGNHGEFETLKQCYENSLHLAEELGCQSIAFPLIATGVYGFPRAEALQIAISVFSAFMKHSDMQIILVVFDRETFVLSDRLFSGVDAFIDEHYVEKKIREEYSRPSYRRMQRRTEATSQQEASSFDVEYTGAMAAPAPLEKSDEALEDDLDEVESDGAKNFLQKPRSLENVIAHLADSWQEMLLHLIDERGFTDTEVYKRANIDRKLFSKIRGNKNYQPKKNTAVAFALALHLNLDETKDLIGRAGYAFSPSSLFDLIIEYFIEQEVFDIYTINLALFDHDQPLLGA